MSSKTQPLSYLKKKLAQKQRKKERRLLYEQQKRTKQSALDKANAKNQGERLGVPSRHARRLLESEFLSRRSATRKKKLAMRAKQEEEERKKREEAMKADQEEGDESAIRKFVLTLAAVAKEMRDKACAQLEQWLATKKKMAEIDMMKLWRALYFCYWLSDKPLIQLELATRLANFIHIFSKPELSFLYLRCYYKTLLKQWQSIDRHRLDKYLSLARLFLRESFNFVKNHEYDEGLVSELCKILSETVLSPAWDIPNGIRFHICDIYVVELRRTVAENCTPHITTMLMEPFVAIIAFTESDELRKYVEKYVLKPFVNQMINYIEAAAGYEEDDEQEPVDEEFEGGAQQQASDEDEGKGEDDEEGDDTYDEDAIEKFAEEMDLDGLQEEENERGGPGAADESDEEELEDKREEEIRSNSSLPALPSDSAEMAQLFGKYAIMNEVKTLRNRNALYDFKELFNTFTRTLEKDDGDDEEGEEGQEEEEPEQKKPSSKKRSAPSATTEQQKGQKKAKNQHAVTQEEKDDDDKQENNSSSEDEEVKTMKNLKLAANNRKANEKEKNEAPSNQQQQQQQQQQQRGDGKKQLRFSLDANTTKVFSKKEKVTPPVHSPEQKPGQSVLKKSAANNANAKQQQQQQPPKQPQFDDDDANDSSSDDKDNNETQPQQQPQQQQNGKKQQQKEANNNNNNKKKKGKKK